MEVLPEVWIIIGVLVIVFGAMVFGIAKLALLDRDDLVRRRTGKNKETHIQELMRDNNLTRSEAKREYNKKAREIDREEDKRPRYCPNKKEGYLTREYFEEFEAKERKLDAIDAWSRGEVTRLDNLGRYDEANRVEAEAILLKKLLK